ncbi:MAG TPA: ABC transporter permease [Gammaproteobacteria bacterium]|nr:ABC transporter permease [Gammaproteobacteria bacterium]
MYSELLRESGRAMRVNRMRTVLTMLGMMIGVAAVVAMLAVGNGARSSVDSIIASMGSNMLIVISGARTSGGLRFATGSTPTLHLTDADAIRGLPGVLAVAPGSGNGSQIVYGANNWSTVVMGTNPDYLQIRDWPLAAGAGFSASDMRGAARVAILGQTVATNLFGDANPVGQTIRIAKSPYLVIGLLAPKGQSFGGQDQDDTVLVPITTAQRKLFGTQFGDTVRYIMVQAGQAELLAPVQAEVDALLRQRHHITGTQSPDFDIRNLTELANAAASTTRIMSLLLGLIASISLVVGGIGIMNIMLVSVTERTREVGLRMAVGARPTDILGQFLMEAVSVSAIGCLAGLLVGGAAVLVVNRLFDMHSVVTASSVLISITVSLAVGTFFGFYPARKASLLQPIEALRHE